MRISLRTATATSVLLALAPRPSWAPMRWVPPYDEMAQKADLVVIATPIARQELDRPATLPGYVHGKEPIAAVEIETTFRLVVPFRSVLSPSDTSFTLVHYRRKEPQDKGGIFIGIRPQLVDFEAGDNSQYLMFLNRREDGRFEGYNSADPGHCIEKLKLAFRRVPARAKP